MRSPRTTNSRTAALGLVLPAALAAACASVPGRHPATPAAVPIAAPATAALPAPSVAGADAAALRAGIVSVRVTGQDWNWRAPWEKQQPWTRTVSGIVVPGRRILVGATAFGNHLLVEVQKLGNEERAVGRVVLVDQEGPLALVAVDEPSFWDGLAPLPLVDRVATERGVTIHRWEASGLLDSYPGTVRQVRAGRHGLSQTSLLTLEVASNVEGLGESEVVIADGRVAGLVTGRSGDAFAALAAPVLQQFLDGSRDGDWRGFARIGASWQDLTNPALREALGLIPGETGIRLTRVASNGSAGGVLRPGDVVLQVGGAKIDSTGRYEHPRYGRMLFALLFTDGRTPGQTMMAKVLRDGQRLDLALPLRRMLPEDDRVPPYLLGRGPDYLIAGGLVFQELTRPYLGAGEGPRRVPPRLLIAADRDALEPSAPPRFVLLSSVLPDAANLGYEDLRDSIVKTVNGRAIGSLADLREALAKPAGPYHVIELLPGQGTRRVVIDAREAEAAAARIRDAYGVPRLDSSMADREAAGVQ